MFQLFSSTIVSATESIHRDGLLYADDVGRGRVQTGVPCSYVRKKPQASWVERDTCQSASRVNGTKLFLEGCMRAAASM